VQGDGEHGPLLASEASGVAAGARAEEGGGKGREWATTIYMKKKSTRPMVDTELLRIQGILGVLDDLNERVWKLKRDCGESAFKRATAYINNRKGWVFNQFRPSAD
jgi:hypothetical protein